MANYIRKNGKCSFCNNPIIRQDKDHVEFLFMAIKSLRVSKINGSIIGNCAQCNNPLDLPAIKVVKTEMSKIDVSIFTKKNTNKS